MILWLFRLTNAFAYYGIVLVTTELFQVDNVCSGMSTSHLIHCCSVAQCHQLIVLYAWNLDPPRILWWSWKKVVWSHRM